jgi:hypothetical protein
MWRFCAVAILVLLLAPIGTVAQTGQAQVSTALPEKPSVSVSPECYEMWKGYRRFYAERGTFLQPSMETAFASASSFSDIDRVARELEPFLPQWDDIDKCEGMREAVRNGQLDRVTLSAASAVESWKDFLVLRRRAELRAFDAEYEALRQKYNTLVQDHNALIADYNRTLDIARRLAAMPPTLVYVPTSRFVIMPPPTRPSFNCTTTGMFMNGPMPMWTTNCN